jgi:DNA repair exonuclease SbcCD ATPase subunit
MKTRELVNSELRTRNSEYRTLNIYCLPVTVFCLLFFVAGCSKQFARIEEKQLQLQTSLTENSEQLAAITLLLEQNTIVQDGQFKNMQARNEKLDSDIADVSKKQIQLQQTSETNHQQLAERITVIANNQQQMQAGLEEVNNSNQRLTSNITSIEQQQINLATAQTQTTESLGGRMTTLESSQQQVQASLVAVNNSNQKINDNISSLEQQQINLATAQTQTTESLGGRMTTLESNQQQVQAGVEAVNNSNQKINDNISSLEQQQINLATAQTQTTESLGGRMTTLESSQQQVQAGLVAVNNSNQKINDNISSLEQQQINLANAQTQTTESLGGRMTALESSQQQVQVGLVAVNNSNQKINDSISSLEQQQINLANAQTQTTESLGGRMTTLESNQQQMQAGLEEVKNSNQRLTSNITSLEQQQINLATAQTQTTESLGVRMTALEGNQQQIQTGLEEANNTNQKVNSNIAALGLQQTNMVDAQQYISRLLNEKITAVDTNQKQIQAGFEEINNSNQRVIGNITALGLQQMNLVDEQTYNNEKLDERIKVIENNQNNLQAGYDILHNGSANIAAGVTAVSNEQIKLQQTVQAGNEQIAEQVLSVENKLTDWQSTVSSIQENILQLSTGINTLGQDFSKLNETFQNNMTTLVTNAGETDQKQLDLHQKIQGELKAMSESIDLIKQSQTDLEKGILTIKDNSQSTSSNIDIHSPVIEQLQMETASQ